jgi:hypothetical protein
MRDSTKSYKKNTIEGLRKRFPQLFFNEEYLMALQIQELEQLKEAVEYTHTEHCKE